MLDGLLEVFGLILVVAGVAIWSPAAALIVAGVVLAAAANRGDA